MGQSLLSKILSEIEKRDPKTIAYEQERDKAIEKFCSECFSRVAIFTGLNYEDVSFEPIDGLKERMLTVGFFKGDRFTIIDKENPENTREYCIQESQLTPCLFIPKLTNPSIMERIISSLDSSNNDRFKYGDLCQKREEILKEVKKTSKKLFNEYREREFEMIKGNLTQSDHLLTQTPYTHLVEVPYNITISSTNILGDINEILKIHPAKTVAEDIIYDSTEQPRLSRELQFKRFQLMRREQSLRDGRFGGATYSEADNEPLFDVDSELGIKDLIKEIKEYEPKVFYTSSTFPTSAPHSQHPTTELSTPKINPTAR